MVQRKEKKKIETQRKKERRHRAESTEGAKERVNNKYCRDRSRPVQN